MQANEHWKELGWRHDLWDLVRFYRSLRSKKQKETWLELLNSESEMTVGDSEPLPIKKENVDLINRYLEEMESLFEFSFSNLRTEEEALEHCKQSGILVGKTATKNKDHHQSSKALVALVSYIATKVASELNLSIDPDPQKRCVWCQNNNLHITARNLDGAIPSLANPSVIWEIKEYWGKTKGGSKMSDAVYECNLVGRELREFETRAGISVQHVVFVDRIHQWNHRKSDLTRFIDLMNQGLIDFLFIGREVESEWERALRTFLL